MPLQRSGEPGRLHDVEITGERLLSAAPAGRITREADRAIVAELHQRRGRELYGFARHLGLKEEEAADAAQEALLRLWTALDDGDTIAAPESWIFRTLYRICMDQHRWRRRVRAITDRLGPPEPVRSADRAEAIAAWEAVERLPERQRLAIYLRYRADLPFEEIGRILGIAAPSARSHVSRALDTLRARLAEPEVTR